MNQLHYPLLTEELESLIDKPYFGRFDHEAHIDNIDFDAACRMIQETAPTWHTLMVLLLSNSRAHRGSYNAPSSNKGPQQTLVYNYKYCLSLSGSEPVKLSVIYPGCLSNRLGGRASGCGNIIRSWTMSSLPESKSFDERDSRT